MKKIIRIAIIAISLVIFTQSLISFFHTATTFTPDFSIFYHSALNILHGKSIYHDISFYTAFNYPFTTALLYIPFTFLPYQVAQEIFVVLNIMCAFGCVFLSFRIMRINPTFPLFFFIVSLFLFSFPTKYTIGMGQSNLMGYACVLFSFLLWQRKRLTFSLLFFILAVILKPTLGFLILFYIVKREWKYTLRFFASLCIIFLVFPFLLGKGNEVTIYVKDIIPHLFTMSGREVYYNQGFSGFISRIFPQLFIRSIFSNIFAVSMISLIFVTRKVDSEKLFAVLLTSLVLLDALSWQHHFVFLLLPLLLVAQIALKQNNKVHILLFIFIYLLIAGNIKNPLFFQQFPDSLVLSHAFFGSILLLVLLIKQESTQSALVKVR